MDIPASIEELMEQFTRVGLVKRCEALGLDTSGSKEELVDGHPGGLRLVTIRLFSVAG